MLRFSDGVNIDTSGPLRIICLADGLYVVGEGICFPENSRKEAEETLRKMQEKRGKKPDDATG